MQQSITITEIESIEAHAQCLIEVAKKMRQKLEKVENRKSVLSAADKAMILGARQKSIDRRARKIKQTI
jgi:hypothetical protein